MVAIKPAIYMSMGPSGAGKDTLLLGARNVLVAAGDMSIDFVPRHVTRAAEKCTEIEVPVTYEVFAEQVPLPASLHPARHMLLVKP